MSQNILFKSKSTKKVNSEKRSTLDAIHQEQLIKMEEQNEKCKELDVLIEEINDKLQYDSPDNIILDITLQKYKKELETLHNKSNIINYYLDTGELLFNYYDIQDKISAQAAWRDTYNQDYFSELT